MFNLEISENGKTIVGEKFSDISTQDAPYGNERDSIENHVRPGNDHASSLMNIGTSSVEETPSTLEINEKRQKNEDAENAGFDALYDITQVDTTADNSIYLEYDEICIGNETSIIQSYEEEPGITQVNVTNGNSSDEAQKSYISFQSQVIRQEDVRFPTKDRRDIANILKTETSSQSGFNGFVTNKIITLMQWFGPILKKHGTKVENTTLRIKSEYDMYSTSHARSIMRHIIHEVTKKKLALGYNIVPNYIIDKMSMLLSFIEARAKFFPLVKISNTMESSYEEKHIISINRSYHGCESMKSRGFKTFCSKANCPNGRMMENQWINTVGKSYGITSYVPFIIPKRTPFVAKGDIVELTPYNKKVNVPLLMRSRANHSASKLRIVKFHREKSLPPEEPDLWHPLEFKITPALRKGKVVFVRRRRTQLSSRGRRSEKLIRNGKLPEHNRILKQRSIYSQNNEDNSSKRSLRRSRIMFSNQCYDEHDGITSHTKLIQLKRSTPKIEAIRALVDEQWMTKEKRNFKVTTYEGKGRGIETKREFKKGDEVLEYSCDLIQMDVASQRESEYAFECNAGSFMLYFMVGNRHFCVDATEDSGRYGRLVNHSKKNANIFPHTKVAEEEGKPRVIFVATRDICKGEELLFDYNDRRKRSLNAHSWLNE